MHKERVSTGPLETAISTGRLLETIFTCTHIPIACMDARFNFIRVNRAYAEADDREPPFFPGKNHFDLYPHAGNQVIFQRVVDTGEPYFAYAKAFEYAEHPERGISYWDWTLMPIKDKGENVIAVILSLENVTAKIQTQEKIRQQNKFLSNIVASLTHPFYVINACDFVVELANNTTAPASIPAGTTCFALTHHRDAPCQEEPHHTCPVREIKRTKQPAMFEHTHVNGDGREIISEVYGFPVFHEKGHVEKVIVYSLDITKRKLTEEKIKNSLKEKEVMLKEIHHRVKNNLQIIISLLNLQADKIDIPEALEAFTESRNRIYSMALVHERLYRSADFSSIDFSEYLQGMTKKLFTTYEITGRVSLNLDIQEILLGVDKAIPCGIIVNELVSNALKYAFPGDRAGSIDISLRALDDGFYELVIKDDGAGMPEDIDFEETESLGLHLVRLLVMQLDGTIAIEKNKGARFTILFPDKIPG
jgi:two-component sensor histidine kinase